MCQVKFVHFWKCLSDVMRLPLFSNYRDFLSRSAKLVLVVRLGVRFPALQPRGCARGLSDWQLVGSWLGWLAVVVWLCCVVVSRVALVSQRGAQRTVAARSVCVQRSSPQVHTRAQQGETHLQSEQQARSQRCNEAVQSRTSTAIMNSLIVCVALCSEFSSHYRDAAGWNVSHLLMKRFASWQTLSSFLILLLTNLFV